MRKIINTVYGSADVEVEEIFPKKVFVVLRRNRILAGTKTLAGKNLKTEMVISRGAVLLSHWEHKERVFYIYNNGLFEAWRSVIHALVGYGVEYGQQGELQQLREVEKELSDVIEKLLCYMHLSKEEIQKVQGGLKGLYEQLFYVGNNLKKEAASKIESAATLQTERKRDGRKILNPSASSARVVAARNRLGKRQEEILRIIAYLSAVKMSLFATIEKYLAILSGVKNDLQKESEHFSSRGLTYSTRERRVFFFRYNKIHNSLLMIRANPFLGAAGLIRYDLASAVASLNRGDGNEFVKFLQKAFNAIRFKEAQAAFERKAILPFSLRLRAGDLDENFVAVIEKRIKNFTDRVKVDLDDDYFVTPRKEDILRILTTVLTKLEKEEFVKAKDLMKKVSSKL